MVSFVPCTCIKSWSNSAWPAPTALLVVLVAQSKGMMTKLMRNDVGPLAFIKEINVATSGAQIAAVKIKADA